MRIEMVLGVGSALLYLHQDCQKCVVHRDIKPSNIMLDASFNAKLGDFGLARLIDHGRGSHTTVLAGTIGYMDPECMVTGNTSIQSDVYSFGVVVLEITCGRPATIADVKGTTIHLVHWVWEFLQSRKDPRCSRCTAQWRLQRRGDGACDGDGTLVRSPRPHPEAPSGRL